MKVIGLTGGIATGKSSVSRLFRRVGLQVIDADNVYKELSKPGKTLYNKIIAAFSATIVGPDYSIDWKKLGLVVFADETKRKRLNELTHPEIGKAIEEQIQKLRATGEEIVIIEIPLLFETGYQKYCDATVVVHTTPETQIRRLMARDMITREVAMQKISSQMPLAEKCRLATYVIDNSLDMTKTEKQFYEILSKIRSE